MRKVFLFLFLALLLSVFCALWAEYIIRDVEFLMPLKGISFSIRKDKYGSGNFNARRKNGRAHKGLDILASSGALVKAVLPGLAIPKIDKDGYGTYVKIYHAPGIETLYAHLKGTCIKNIRFVKKGEVIGWVGKTGNARYNGIKPHLHFEIRHFKRAIDPINKIGKYIK